MTLSYTFVKLALQEAGLVLKGRTRGRHRRRREPRPCFGELLHLDGSRHAWLALYPAERQTLIAVLDDATSSSTRRPRNTTCCPSITARRREWPCVGTGDHDGAEYAVGLPLPIDQWLARPLTRQFNKGYSRNA